MILEAPDEERSLLWNLDIKLGGVPQWCLPHHPRKRRRNPPCGEAGVRQRHRKRSFNDVFNSVETPAEKKLVVGKKVRNSRCHCSATSWAIIANVVPLRLTIVEKCFRDHDDICENQSYEFLFQLPIPHPSAPQQRWYGIAFMSLTRITRTGGTRSLRSLDMERIHQAQSFRTLPCDTSTKASHQSSKMPRVRIWLGHSWVGIWSLGLSRHDLEMQFSFAGCLSLCDSQKVSTGELWRFQWDHLRYRLTVWSLQMQITGVGRLA